ncbi:hypothetical protein LEP1GSC103_2588 [Leptospira borgpetersenii serovar Javanica str. UI 09931]|uniref:Uncharacterized protein n=1 Tax=Leptospira borgpetersenii serovar Javanica str. UI 09931 TaxID=1049767 RepID=A0AAV3JCG4_LEPBO|nr:hypothetical protein C4Q31_00405 [Leptospira borgpetersenii serovar Ceylonica]EPG58373.1 hypothetical protein LEP1GSC103_2588 [Leptospira borgpetersenii serovar Javanica str. UI 09931]
MVLGHKTVRKSDILESTESRKAGGGNESIFVPDGSLDGLIASLNLRYGALSPQSLGFFCRNSNNPS